MIKLFEIGPKILDCNNDERLNSRGIGGAGSRLGLLLRDHLQENELIRYLALLALISRTPSAPEPASILLEYLNHFRQTSRLFVSLGLTLSPIVLSLSHLQREIVIMVRMSPLHSAGGRELVGLHA